MFEEDLLDEAEIEQRQAFVDNLGEYLITAKNSIQSLIGRLGWTEDILFKDSATTKVRCPFNPGHIMPATSLEKHTEICAWKNEGYSKEEIDQALPSSHFFYQNSTSVVPVLIDKTMQFEILRDSAMNSSDHSFVPVERNVPRTMDRVITEFTPRERLSIYEFVIDKMKQIKKESLMKFEDLQFALEAKRDSGTSKPKSKLELIAENRDYKRRRQSYRAKNVHITKKSYTEIMREIIQNQMDVLCDANESSIEDASEIPANTEQTDYNKNKSYRQDTSERPRSLIKRSHDYEDDRSEKSRSSNKRSYEYDDDKNKMFRSSSKRSYEYDEDKDKMFRSSSKRSYKYDEEKNKMFRSSSKRSYEYEEEKNKMFRSSSKHSYEYDEGRNEVSRSSNKRAYNYEEERTRVSSHHKHKREKLEEGEYRHKHHHKHHKHKKSKSK